MEDEILLDVYRRAWNDFLEAYKKKMDQNDALFALVTRLEALSDKEGKELIKKELQVIKEI